MKKHFLLLFFASSIFISGCADSFNAKVAKEEKIKTSIINSVDIAIKGGIISPSTAQSFLDKIKIEDEVIASARAMSITNPSAAGISVDSVISDLLILSTKLQGGATK